MSWSVVLAGVLAIAGAHAISAQQPPRATAPVPTDAVTHGSAVFGNLCASCHGGGGAGGRAPALLDNRRLRAMPEAELQSIIRNGTANGMPGFGSQPAVDVQDVTLFVRALNSSAFEVAPAGSLVEGEAFFFGKGGCASCHLAAGRGTPSGPDLSSVGRQMTLVELTRALTDPGATIAQGYGTVRVHTKDGRTLRGFARNEGNHVLPLQTLDGKLVAIDKDGAQVTREPGSLMPALKATADEQRDLTAYLSRLGGATGPRSSAPSPAPDAATAFDEILKPRPGDWPTYHGRMNGNRHSEHAQVGAGNVQALALQWIHSLRGFDNEMTPLVLDGIMYITGPNQASALDAASGREVWRFSRPRTPGLRGDAARGFNRGVAVLGSRVFFVTDNAHLLALSRVNGALLWEVVLPEKPELPYGGTMAPLVVGDLVIAGVSGGDEGIRGFIAAYDVGTGTQAWRFWTVPARGEPAADSWQGNLNLDEGGGSTWLTGAYDPDTGTLYWPTGNPYPDTDGSQRKGDNLYTNSILALEAKTGKLRWYYQFTPHDLWDWDAEEPPLLVDAAFQGSPRKLLLQANRNGFFYVLDRSNGALLLAKPFVKKLTWASAIGPDGRPQLAPGNTPTPAGVLTCPAIRGATNWMSTAFNPATRLFYVMAVENCFLYRSTMFGGARGDSGARPAGSAPQQPPAAPAAPVAAPPAGGGRGGQGAPQATIGLPAGGFNPGGTGGGGSMVLRALDIETGHVAWEIPQTGNSNNYAGALSTAGGIVFYGQASGEFAAVDAKTGAHLWHFETQETWKSSPMTYMVNGRQYIAIASGANVLSFALPSTAR
jgi:PQQ-dependent dehydrogenase (methanol/ethanol family)